MTVVRVPVGTPDCQRDFITSFARDKPATLLRKISSLNDPQAAYQLLRLSAVPRLNHLLRMVPPELTENAAREFDTMMAWTMGHLITSNKATDFNLPTEETFFRTLQVAVNTNTEAIRRNLNFNFQYRKEDLESSAAVTFARLPSSQVKL